MSIVSNFIKNIAIEYGADFVGIAPSERMADAPEMHKPTDLLVNAKSVIVCGCVLPKGSLNCPGTIYANIVERMQQKLDFIALRIAKRIEESNAVALPIPTHGPIFYWNAEEMYAQADFSLRHAAEAAGLGRISRSSIFISKEYGVYTRLVAILTDEFLSPDPVLDWDPCPKNCTLCIDSCPVNAITLEGRTISKECRNHIFRKTMKGVMFEDCRECIKACPHVYLYDNV